MRNCTFHMSRLKFSAPNTNQLHSAAAKRIDAWKRQRGDSQVASKMKVAERKHRCLSY